MNRKLAALAQKNVDVVLHPASSISLLEEQGPHMITRAKGCDIYDHEGNQFLDAMAGLWCVNVGYGRAELAQIVKEATEQLAYYPTFANASNPWQVALAEKILSHAPPSLSKVFYGSSGSDANDTLIKIAWHYHTLRGKPKKIKVIARENAYHGTSISTASLTGLPSFHREYPIPLDFVVRTQYPHYYSRGYENESEEAFCDRLIDDVEQIIAREGADKIAMFFAEPIMAAGGIIEPPANYYPRLRTLLEQHDILFVADEVVCGFGRLGDWFGSLVFDMQPDMLSAAKGLSSGYFPMSISMISEDIWKTLREGSQKLGGFFHGYTYSGHPVGAAVSLANIELIEHENLVGRAQDNGAFLHRLLHTTFADHPKVGEIRGQGLLAGIQLVSDKATRTLPDVNEKLPAKVAAECKKRGVIVRPLPGVGTVALSPPLIISRTELERVVSVLKQSIDVVSGL